MAYPTGMLSLTLEEVDRLAINTKNFAAQKRSAMLAGSVSSESIIEVHTRMKHVAARMQAAASLPGIGQYARDQKNDQALDVVAEFQAMLTAINSVATAIEAGFPTFNQSGTDYLLAQTWGATGPVDRQFTPAQTAGIATALQAVVNSIS